VEVRGIAGSLGYTSGEFEPVRAAFDALLAADPGYAAQLAVYCGGDLVVDLCGGPGIRADSLIAIASCTKGAAYVCTAMLVQDGVLDLDQRVAHYWPQFAAAGKDQITVRQLLSHQGGLIGVDGGFTLDALYDDRQLAARLAVQRPYWRPGAAHGYHGFTIGPLAGELIYRTTGVTLHEFYAGQVRDSRGVDLFVGLPEEHEQRVLDLQPARLPPGHQDPGREPAAPDSLPGIAFTVPVDDLGRLAAVNSRRWRAAGPASGGGMASARGLARLYACSISAVDGQPPLLTPDTAAEFAQVHSSGHDMVMLCPSRFGLGFQVPADEQPYLSARTFGHDGGSGSWGFADPYTALGFGYIRRRVTHPGGLGDDSAQLARAARRCAPRPGKA
jgi:CubicO group peptidase (beta-lactamase class C family)